MDMVTELVVEAVKIKGGQKMYVAEYVTPNKMLYDGLTWLGKGLRWLMECKSNNMTRAVQPHDIRKLWKLWEAHKKDFDLGQKHSDSPTPVYEFRRSILLPHPKEMRRYKNIKIQRVASEIHFYCHVAMTRDSSDGTHIYDLSDYEEIQAAQLVCEEFMLLHVGTGQPIEGQPGKWSIGLDIPPLTEVGTEVPPADLDTLTFEEPSSTAPDSVLPDAPDTDRVTI